MTRDQSGQENRADEARHPSGAGDGRQSGVSYPPIIKRLHPGPDATHNERVRAAAKIAPILLVLAASLGGATFIAGSTLNQYLLVLTTQYLRLPRIISYAVFLILLASVMYAISGEAGEGLTPIRWIAGAASGLSIACTPLLLLIVGILHPTESVRSMISMLVVLGVGVIVAVWNIKQYRRHDVGLWDVNLLP